MSAWVEISFEIYCWAHLPSGAPRVQDPDTRRATEFPLPAPASGFTFPAGCCFYMHIWALLTHKARTLGASSLILGFFFFLKE